ncbi:hypothetical protein M3193_14050 [Sporosarcina luteola]|uniref:anti-sigma factor domain-containing protein n=1 Tax=Sporosarcina luteola TaxID=582850 RepID=UPI00204187FF|nr:hypothetical protein [Sporosarcina luteola]MCM3745258.1 hypothetical protein [Sporosarcina luteola]
MMRTYRGVVCEKKTTYMVFLTEKGEFLRGVPVGNPPEVGEEAEFTLVAPSIIAGGKAKQRFVGAVLIAAAVLFFMLSSVNPLNEKVMAYVQLDAGTAMEFGVNRSGNVVSLRYLQDNLNEEDHLSAWKGQPIQAILDMAMMELTGNDDKQVSITTIYSTRERAKQTRQLIGDALQEVRGNHEELTLDIAESTPEERKVANEKNMSIQQLRSIESKERKHPEKNSDPVEKKPAQPQKDALQKPKKDTVPSVHSQQHKTEKERSNKSGEQQGPPAEKYENKPTKGQSDKVQPQTDKKGPPPHSSSGNKHNNNDQGPPAKQQKENPSKEKKENPHNNK